MQKILIIGATSAIAEATAKQWVNNKNIDFYLLARNQERLACLAQDLRIRGASSVHYDYFEAADFASHHDLLAKAIAKIGGVDLVLIAYGVLGDQEACEKNITLALEELTINALSVISVLTYLANYMEGQHKGTIAVISSVAGDRGRQSNYIYGTAKGAVSIFLQGLRNRLSRQGVQVLTIKPGFVDTPMTSALKKGLFWTTPDKVAAGIIKAIEKKREIVYLPGWWRLVMLAIKIVPECIFKRLSL